MEMSGTRTLVVFTAVGVALWRFTAADRSRTSAPKLASDAASHQGGGSTLTGIAAVQGAFHFLLGPAEVLNAAITCRRWGELACADSVWRSKIEREGLLEKARVFEVALPVHDEHVAAGAGLAFYAQVFALQVMVLHSSFYVDVRSCRTCFRLTTARSLPGRGTR